MLPQHLTTLTSEEVSHTNTQSPSTTRTVNVTANQTDQNSSNTQSPSTTETVNVTANQTDQNSSTVVTVATCAYISSGVIGTLIVLVVVLLTTLVYLNRKYKRVLNVARQGSQGEEIVMATQLCSGISTKINCEYDDTGCDNQVSTYDNACYDSANHIYETPMNY